MPSAPLAAGDELIKLWPQAKAHALSQREATERMWVDGLSHFFSSPSPPPPSRSQGSYF